MESETHRWYSDRIGRDVHVRVYGHFGQPILVFPTSGGDESEQNCFHAHVSLHERKRTQRWNQVAPPSGKA